MKKPTRKRTIKIVSMVVLLLLSLAIINGIRNNDGPTDPKPLSEAITKIENNKVERIEVLSETKAVSLILKNEKTVDYGVPNIEGPGGLNQLIVAAKKADVPVAAAPGGSGGFFSGLLGILPTLLLLGLIIALIYVSKAGPFSKVRVAPSRTNVHFSDVAGAGEAIEELREVEQFLLDPKKFVHLGARSPQGVLLYGPPGTGKTLLAKALANEAKVRFYAVSGSEFIEVYAGVGARRVRQLFEEAKKNAPAIIFIDEIDAIAGKRSAGAPADGGSREADQTINEILRQMDGFDSNRENPVIVIGATNRLEVLDPAVIRPGRFDRQIAVDAPDKNGRVAILEVHSQDKTLGDDVDLDQVAVQTAGMTGADLARLMNEAALHAARRNGQAISAEDIDDAYFRVVAGAKKQHRVLSPEELQKVAYHEAGHALIGEALPGGQVVHKVSIIPRGQSGGQTLYVSEEDVFLYSEENLRDNICSMMGGRAAEEIVFGSVSSGAADDLNRATQIATKMVSELGMSEAVGLRTVGERDSLSDHQQETIDREVNLILEAEYNRAKKILSEKRQTLELLTEKLLQEEVVDREQFLEIIEND